MHPDGSYAGEYGSRNTYHFYPHGFEVMAGLGDERARWVADMFLHRALPEGRRYFNDDDRMAAHYVYDWMQSWRDYAPRTEGSASEAGESAPPPAAPERVEFAKAGLCVQRSERAHVVANLRKGGVFKAFGANGPIASDTGPMLQLRDGSVLVSHMMDATEERNADLEAGVWSAKGRLHRRKQKLATPWTQILFRAFTTTLGRFAPNVTRATLQKILITGKRPTEFRFERTIEIGDDALVVRDAIAAPGPLAGTPREVVRMAFGCDATSIYVANSNTFQESTLLPWTWVSAEDVAKLNATGRAEFERRIPFPEA
jgi:hypothetical protein